MAMNRCLLACVNRVSPSSMVLGQSPLGGVGFTNRGDMRAFLLGSVILGFAVVAGATTVSIDLTATGGATLSGGTANGTILDATSAPTTVGTGVIDSFVRMQATGNGTSEQGYNTD